MLYFAYGSNLLKAGMRERCPAAVAIGPARLAGHRRVFRQWADVEPAAGSCVEGGLWRITPSCLTALDDYEDLEIGLYRRLSQVVTNDGGGIVEAILYRMNGAAIAPPEADYLTAVLRGCRDFGVDEGPVLAAVEAARDGGAAQPLRHLVDG